MKGKSILLDIDGTLASDGAFPDALVLQKIEAIKKIAPVFFVSNSPDKQRNEKLGSLTGIPFLSGKKPWWVQVPHIQGQKVVIGDKILFDGLFARRIGAQFIHTKRPAGKVSILAKIVYIVDDLGSIFYDLLS